MNNLHGFALRGVDSGWGMKEESFLEMYGFASRVFWIGDVRIWVMS